ncbi:MAG: dihydrofolate reductase [Alkaliphilus sp.]|nr:MAG: dihydrofolate reductase [Alkaliphilus sp.]
MKAISTVYFTDKQKTEIEELGYNLIMTDEQITNSVCVNDAEVLICYNPFRTLDIGKMPKLKWIQLTSIGIDQVPKGQIEERKIALTNNKGGYSIPMGEWIVLKMLEVYKNSFSFYKQQENKKWEMRKDVYELFNKKILFIGTGTIAKEAAKRLSGFQVNICGVNTTGRKVEHFRECFKMGKLKEVIKEADVIVITIPYTEKTHHLVNAELLDLMKKNSVLINVSRGNIVDEVALLDSLNKDHFLGVALDVFEEEPLPKKSALWDFKRVLITPHNSWMSEMRNERRYSTIYENMKRYADGSELINSVDLSKGY